MCISQFCIIQVSFLSIDNKKYLLKCFESINIRFLYLKMIKLLQVKKNIINKNNF